MCRENNQVTGNMGVEKAKAQKTGCDQKWVRKIQVLENAEIRLTAPPRRLRAATHHAGIQRDSGSKPRVAAPRLPWGIV